MGNKVTVDALVEGGKAFIGSPIGLALGPNSANPFQKFNIGIIHLNLNYYYNNINCTRSMIING
ncbi:MAG: hypothetical protein EAX96_11775 [Candidatus Lokiarchaeota archaeon]|nr:hypothetical protein [Candidatus Lokiarchaeota archaeon]